MNLLSLNYFFESKRPFFIRSLSHLFNLFSKLFPDYEVLEPFLVNQNNNKK